MAFSNTHPPTRAVCHPEAGEARRGTSRWLCRSQQPEIVNDGAGVGSFAVCAAQDDTVDSALAVLLRTTFILPAGFADS